MIVTKGSQLAHLAARVRRDLPMKLCDIHFDEEKAKKDPTAPFTFEGYGSVWGRTDSYGDTVHKGAFAESLKERTPIMLYSHNPTRVPGKWLSASEDDKGLRLVGELTPGHSEASDLAASLRHQSLTGLSIGGYTKESTPKHEKNPYGGRDITKFDLYEVSPVAMPAENEARIDTQSVKMMLDECGSPADFEELLREAGFSKTASTAFISRLSRILRGEPGEASETSKAASTLLATLRTLGRTAS
jgi:HK97 family phage prohead protease